MSGTPYRPNLKRLGGNRGMAMKRITGCPVLLAAIAALSLVACLAVKVLSQGQTTPEARPYIDENGEPQIVGQPLNPERVSLVRLIVNRERYDGKRVETQGFFVWAFEHMVLYISSDDAWHGLSYNGLSVGGSVGSGEPGEGPNAVGEKAHLQYVTVVGTFHKLGDGHLNIRYAGGLTDIVVRRVHRKSPAIPAIRSGPASKGANEQHEGRERP